MGDFNVKHVEVGSFKDGKDLVILFKNLDIDLDDSVVQLVLKMSTEHLIVALLSAHFKIPPESINSFDGNFPKN